MKVDLLIQGSYIGDADCLTMDVIDPDTLVISEESSTDSKGHAGTIFYIREKNRRDGYTYQSTALTLDAAKWVINELRRSQKEWLTTRGPGAITST